MANHARHAILSEGPPFDRESGALRAVVETPKGSRNKYDYDPEFDCFNLANVLPDGMFFPYYFGFVPSTLGEDGDPLDVLVLMDAPVIPGCVVQTRLIGAIEAQQKSKGEKWIENDRLLAVAVHAHSHDHVRSLGDLGPHLLREIKAFFVEYNQLRDRKFKPVRDGGPKEALELVKAGMAASRKTRPPPKH